MNISSVGQAHSNPQLTDRPRVHGRPENQPVPSAITPEATDLEEQASATVVAKSGQGERTKGVISLLESGHFKGVAAVRLAINFHDELSARRLEAGSAELGEAVEGLGNQVDEALAGLPEAITTEQQEGVELAEEQFNTAIRSTFERFNGGEIELANAQTGFQAAYDELLLAVKTVVPTDSAIPDVDDDGIAATESAEVADKSDSVSATAGEVEQAGGTLLQALDTVFSSFMESLQSSNAFTMPDFTAPNSNGAAFEKFVSMYREIAGSTVAEAAVPETEDAIDQLA